MNAELLAEQVLAASGGRTEEAEARLLVLEERRRQARYACYYEPAGDQRHLWERLTPQHRIILLLGGNGSGKSLTGEWFTTAFLLGKEFFKDEPCWKWIDPLPIPDGPTNVRVVALNTDMLRDPIWDGLFGSATHPSMIPLDMVTAKSDQHFTATLKNGSRVQGKSADTDPKTHGGANCQLVVIDEECHKAIFDENYQRTRNGGYLLVTATPLDDVGTVAQPWIFDLIQRAEQGDPEILVVFMSTLNNPYLSDDWKRRQIAKWKGHPEEQARLYGRPVRRSGLYYKQWKSEPPLWVPAYDLPATGMNVVMIDPAVTGTVGAVWAHFDSRGKMTIKRTYKRKGLTVSQHVENILTENRGDPIRLWYCDPWMGRQRVPDATARDQHHTVLQVWREAGLPRLQIPDIDYDLCLARSHEYIKAAFDPTDPHPPMEVFDHNEDFLWEVERYVIDSVVQGPNRGDTRDKPRKGRDGASTLMECFQYLAGLNLRARPTDRAISPQPAGSQSYFGSGAAGSDPARFAPKVWAGEPG